MRGARSAPVTRTAKSRGGDGDTGSGGGGLDGLKRWVEEKKAQGTGGASGAVVGGMVAGPLGAMVGAALGSKIGPTVGRLVGDVDETLKKADDAGGSDERPGEDSQKSKDQAGGEQKKGGVKRWVEEKKAQGTGGAGGAVVGGLVAGPLGAVVGAAMGSKLGALISDAEDGEEPADRAVKETATSSKPSAPDVASAAPDPVSEPAGVARKSEVAIGGGGQTREAAADPFLMKRRKAAKEALERTEAVYQKTGERCEKLRNEMDDLHAKAERCLAAGDDQEARALLQSRAALQQPLAEVQQLLEDATAMRQKQQQELSSLGGEPLLQDSKPVSNELDVLKQQLQAKRAAQSAAGDAEPRPPQEVPPTDELSSLKQKLEERRRTLQADAEERYAAAEELLRAGDEQGARRLLAEYQDLKLKLKSLADM